MPIAINNTIITINCDTGAQVDSIVIKNKKNEYHEFSSVDRGLSKELRELKKALSSLVESRCYLNQLDGPRLEHLKSVTIDKTPFLSDDVTIEFEKNGKKLVRVFPANWGELSEINDKLKAIACKSLEPSHSVN